MASITITLPELGEGVDSVDVVAVLVAVGDTIEVDQSLIEVETEKASVEVPSTTAGTVTEIHVQNGDILGENAPIVTFEAAEASRAAAGRSPQTPRPCPIRVPKTGRAKPEPSRGAKGREAADRSPHTEVGVGSTLRHPRHSDADVMTAIPAAPTVRRFAREVGVDLTTVSGSGPGGRISIDDVKAEANRRLSGGAVAGGSGDGPRAAGSRAIRACPPRADDQGPQADRRKSHPRLAHDSSGHQPRDRRHHRSRGFPQGLQGACRGRRRQADHDRDPGQDRRHRPQGTPEAQRRVDMARQEIVFRYSINIGVAVDTDRGLLVPVIRDADAKNLTEIAIVARRPRQSRAVEKAQARRDAGRNVLHLQPRRHRRHRLLADRQLARGGDPRRFAGPHRTPVARGQLPAAADAAAVVVLRPPAGRRRRCRTFPGKAQGRVGDASAFGAGRVTGRVRPSKTIHHQATKDTKKFLAIGSSGMPTRCSCHLGGTMS